MADGVYEFEGFRLDAGRRTLSDPAGKPVALAPRVFDTLHYLVVHSGELVEKNALIEAVWPDVTVEENSLSQNISTLRRTLGDKTGENRFIVTAPGRGYRFVAKASLAEGGGAATSAKAKPVEPAIDKVRVSVAVMPFANLTGDPDQEYFSDGMAEEIINLLTRTSAIKAPSRTSTFAYKGRNVDLRQIAEDLGVDAVLEGSIRAAGKRVRITAQLIDGASGFHLWSETFDRDMTDVFALQDELALSILEAMQTHLNAPLSKNRRPRARTNDVEAYRLCLQADYLSQNNNSSDMEEAIALYQQALAHDPNFARAHSGLVRTESVQFSLLSPQKERGARIEAHARKALSLDPQSEAAHNALASFYADAGKLCDADHHFRLSIGIGDDPMVKQGYSVMVLSNAGHLRRGLKLCEGAFQLLPIAPFIATALGMMHLTVGNDDIASRYVRHALDIGHRETSVPMCDLLALMSARSGEFQKAADYILAAMPSEELTGGASTAIREAYLALGDASRRPSAIKALLAPEFLARMDHSPIYYKRVLLWLTCLGAIDEAYAWMDRVLDRLAKEGSVGTIWSVIWLQEMKGFCEDRRFADLAERIGLADYWREYGPPDGYEFANGRLVPI